MVLVVLAWFVCLTRIPVGEPPELIIDIIEYMSNWFLSLIC